MRGGDPGDAPEEAVLTAVSQLGLVSRYGRTWLPKRFREEMGLAEGGAVLFELTQENGVKVLLVRVVRTG